MNRDAPAHGLWLLATATILTLLMLTVSIVMHVRRAYAEETEARLKFEGAYGRSAVSVPGWLPRPRSSSVQAGPA